MVALCSFFLGQGTLESDIDYHRFIDLILFNHQTLGFNHQDWDNGDIMEIDSDMFVA